VSGIEKPSFRTANITTDGGRDVPDVGCHLADRGYRHWCNWLLETALHSREDEKHGVMCFGMAK
jgi:hypothetical protein